MGFHEGPWCSESSTVRKGSVFYDDDNSKDTSSEKSVSVLIVDDDTPTRKLNELLLTLSGMEVEGAANGQEAIDLHCVGKSYHLILMDIEMPVKNGYQATKELRNMGVYCAIVGVISMDENDTVMDNFMKAGLDECIRKPLTLEKIQPFITGKPNYDYDHEVDDDDDDDDDDMDGGRRVISSCSSSNSLN